MKQILSNKIIKTEWDIWVYNTKKDKLIRVKWVHSWSFKALNNLYYIDEKQIYYYDLNRLVAIEGLNPKYFKIFQLKWFKKDNILYGRDNGRVVYNWKIIKGLQGNKVHKARLESKDKLIVEDEIYEFWKLIK